MADQLQLRRGTTAQIATFTGAQGEIIVDTDKDTIVVQDGATPGGFPLASESAVVDGTFYFNDDVSGGSIANSYILSPKANTNTPTSYMDGQQYGFVTANANTGPSTATFSGLGVKSLKYRGGIDPAAGDISGRVYLIYDSANDWFEIQRKAIAPPQQIRSITGSVSSNALTMTMLPDVIDFRAPTLSSGTVNTRTITSSLSITVPSGATLGTTSAIASRIVLLAVDNAGTVSLAVVNAAATLSLDETSLINTTAISAGSTSASTVYAAANLSGVPFRVLGYVDSTQPTAGTWNTTPTQVQGQGGQNILGIPKLAMAAAQNTTSGTSIDFTGIPSWARRINIMFNGISTSGTSDVLIQLGAGSVETANYLGATSTIVTGTAGSTQLSSGFLASISGSAATVRHGLLTLSLCNGNAWTCSGIVSNSNESRSCHVSGSKALAGVLDRIRLTTVVGTDTFDLGVINIMYEG